MIGGIVSDVVSVDVVVGAGDSVVTTVELGTADGGAGAAKGGAEGDAYRRNPNPEAIAWANENIISGVGAGC